MINRWTILAVLFLARTAMGFQFQAIGALSPLMVEAYGLNLADIGLLIGLYLAPGVILAVPGGALGARIGEKRFVVIGLGLMLAGGSLMLVSQSWEALVIARLLAGSGGVILNVLTAKMLVDWFVGREISTAMAIFLNSWPVGIALALLVLPTIALSVGLMTAWIATSVVILCGLLLFATIYTPPPGAAIGNPSLKLARIPVVSTTAAGMIWGFYNAAFVMIFSFTPILLTSRGWSIEAAGSLTSTFMVIFAIAAPLGGVLADWSKRSFLIIGGGILSFVVLIPAFLILPTPIAVAAFLVLSVLFALPAGPIVALPSTVLSVEARTFGMGVFFAIYYVAMMIAPRLAGGFADQTGKPEAAFYTGIAFAIIALISLIIFMKSASSAKG